MNQKKKELLEAQNELLKEGQKELQKVGNALVDNLNNGFEKILKKFNFRFKPTEVKVELEQNPKCKQFVYNSFFEFLNINGFYERFRYQNGLVPKTPEPPKVMKCELGTDNY